MVGHVAVNHARKLTPGSSPGVGANIMIYNLICLDIQMASNNGEKEQKSVLYTQWEGNAPVADIIDAHQLWRYTI